MSVFLLLWVLRSLHLLGITNFLLLTLRNLLQTEVSAKSLHESVGQRFDSYQCQGVLPSELDQKLCHLLIEQQENQIEGLESELNLAQSKIREKEVELQALKDCVRRLTNFSLSTVSGKSSYFCHLICVLRNQFRGCFIVVSIIVRLPLTNYALSQLC